MFIDREASLCYVPSVDVVVGVVRVSDHDMCFLELCKSIQDVIIVPRVMGHIMGLSPALILLSLSVWGYIAGFLGLIIALPVTTLILSYYKRYIIKD